MADSTTPELRRFAELGARLRLDELDHERQLILRTFPHLHVAAPPAAATATANGNGNGNGDIRRGIQTERGRKKRRKMSPAARKAVSKRMKKYWAGRRADKPFRLLEA